MGGTVKFWKVRRGSKGEARDDHSPGFPLREVRGRDVFSAWGNRRSGTTRQLFGIKTRDAKV